MPPKKSNPSVSSVDSNISAVVNELKEDLEIVKESVKNLKDIKESVNDLQKIFEEYTQKWKIE